jgi:hypothetical protein
MNAFEPLEVAPTVGLGMQPRFDGQANREGFRVQVTLLHITRLPS